VLKEGFQGRVWLTVSEWETFRRRVAVRYPQGVRPAVIERDGSRCSICGLDAADGRPRLQLAHRIPFKIGVVDWGLTPDWLDGVENLSLAHAGRCNDQVELQPSEIPARLRELRHRLDESPSVAAGMVQITPGAEGDVVEFRTGLTSGSKK
jgi:hypothetical protein